ncbi:putative diacyglycerol O-acyltransferase tgs1 [Nocardioides szechwanensis]|uniref:Diacylglycerol O-acyltransferase n=1 Tax=Nocardioides szechwanensis TaxID=1005944 RepID=A0A1H0L2H2_9ACTN|nr:wax ester/triacylglycerol synthase family O-acyltransferase [Nocardioides szechwanensis]GEP35591.1 putative diacyglycerol O-acyltransferase tgs1 [Nocardioides szechwanensis]SDO62437.1 Diacylglycerol O-acyltransferase [Nocardioides szechwanensis]
MAQMERLTPLSAAFLEAENVDPLASLAIGSLAVFEGPAPDFYDFVKTIEGRLPLIPRYRQRLRNVPFDLAPPAWVDDPEFDVRNQVRRVALPAPGGRAEIGELMSREMAVPMDRSNPLWEYLFVEGLEGGQWALLSKVHHSMVDGVSGTDIYRLVLDAGPEPSPSVPDTWVPEAPVSEVEFTMAALRDLAASPGHLAGAAVRGLRRPWAAAAAGLRSARGVVEIAGALLPTTRSTLTGPLDGSRRYSWTTADLTRILAARTALGVTVNDLALTAVSGGFRRLLESRGEVPHAHTLRTLVPVSTRRPGTEAVPGNEVSLLLPYLPVDLEDPLERLAAVRERVQTLRAHHEDEAGGQLTLLSQLAPFPTVSAGIRLGMRFPQRQITTVATNVPGPRQPLWCLGRRAVEMLPYVPIADRVRIGIVIFSYCDTLTFGLTGDFETVPDLDLLTDGIAASLEELLVAAR